VLCTNNRIGGDARAASLSTPPFCGGANGNEKQNRPGARRGGIHGSGTRGCREEREQKKNNNNNAIQMKVCEGARGAEKTSLSVFKKKFLPDLII